MYIREAARRRRFDLESFYLFLKITHSVLSSFCLRSLWTRSLINWKTEYINGARLLPINKETCIYTHILMLCLVVCTCDYFIAKLCWSVPMRKTVVFKWDLYGGYADVYENLLGFEQMKRYILLELGIERIDVSENELWEFNLNFLSLFSKHNFSMPKLHAVSIYSSLSIYFYMQYSTRVRSEYSCIRKSTSWPLGRGSFIVINN